MVKTRLVCLFAGILLIGSVLFPSSAQAVGVSPTTINFGSIIENTASTTTLVVTNNTRYGATLDSVLSSLPQFVITGPALPLYLPAHASASFQVTFQPNSVAIFSGTVTVTTSHKGTQIATVALSGTGVAPAPAQTYQLSLSTGGIWFGNQTIIGTTASMPFTVTNTGTGSVTISQVTAAGSGFSVSGFSGATTLAPGQSVSLAVKFAPTATGYAAGNVSVISTATNSPTTFPVSGTGAASTQTYQLSLSTTGIAFGNQAVYNSSSLPFTVTNTGTGSVSISQVTVTGAGFGASGFSGAATLAAGQSLSLSANFAPTATGSVSGSLSVVSTATNSPATIPLSGTGVKPLITVIPSSVAFGNAAVGVTNTQTITVQNPGSGTLTVTQASLSPTGFSLSGLALPLSVAPGGSASFNVGFTPTSAGSLSGSLALTSNATYPALSIPLSGSGVASALQLAANPTSLSFGSLTTGTSASQTVTLTNAGNSAVSISQISASGTGFSTSGIALPLSLAAGQSTSFSVTFAPASAGSLPGSVTVVSNATNSPLTVALSGTGAVPVSHAVALNWTPSSSTYSGFNVYRGTTSGGPYTKVDSSVIPTTSYSDAGVTSGKTYYYVATEVDSTGMESGYSSEATATIP